MAITMVFLACLPSFTLADDGRCSSASVAAQAGAGPLRRWSTVFGASQQRYTETVRLGEADQLLLDVEELVFERGLVITAGARVVVEDLASRNYRIRASHVLLMDGGELHVGSEDCPFQARLELTLVEGAASAAHPHFGERVLGVGRGGRLELHGARGLHQHSWSKLAETAYAGATQIKLVRDDLEWRVGDVLVLASTDFNMEQAEQVRVVEVVGPARYTIHPPLKYMHFGAITYGVDERGEVGLLSRNIVVQGDGPLNSGVGGHSMFMEGFKAVRIEGVEFANMGQASTVGRYPVHFHLCDRVPVGTYVRFNSVHHSNFRCVTIHGTHGVTVQGNVAYDHLGHCFFLEDGVEEDNVFDSNLGLVTRKKHVNGPAGGQAGLRSDWEAPSTFWITHPNNVLINNVAGGSEHTGIWYLFREAAAGLSRLSGRYNSMVAPSTVPLATHRGNVVHSCGTAGLFLEPTNHNPALDHDGLTPENKPPFTAYHPVVGGVPSVTVFEDVTVYKVRIKGAWFRGLAVWFKNCRFADNQSGLTIASAGSHPDGDGGGLTTGSIFVGWSDNKGQDVAGQPPMNLQRGATTPQGPGVPIRGYQFYDGPQSLEDCSFYQFASDRYAQHSALALFYQNTWQMAVTNRVKHLTFDEVSRRYWVQAAQAPEYVLRLDGDTNAVVADTLGAVSGYRDATILTNHAYFRTLMCNARADWNAVVCPHRYVNVWIENLATNETPAPALRELFTPTLNTIRDQFPVSASWQDMRQEVLGIPQFDRFGNKFRYQVVATPEASYMLNFPYGTPSLIRIQLNNGHVSDALRYGVCYPSGSRVVQVMRGLFVSNHEPGSMSSATALHRADSLTALSFLSGDAYYWDDQRHMLLVTLKQRFTRVQEDAYCPPKGCEQVWLQVEVPAGSAAVECGNVAYPAYQDSSSPFLTRPLRAAMAAVQGAEAITKASEADLEAKAGAASVGSPLAKLHQRMKVASSA